MELLSYFKSHVNKTENNKTPINQGFFPPEITEPISD